MADAYIGEIRMFGGNFAPQDWLICEGQVLSIFAYMELFSLITNTYGGNGTSTFALPDMRGRMPIHRGQGTGTSMFTQGEAGGLETVTLTPAQLPSHKHTIQANRMLGDASSPAGAVWAPWTEGFQYTDQAPDVAMHASAISTTGLGQGHSNISPYCCVNFIICVTTGQFPPRS